MVDTETVSTINVLGVKVFNPFHCLCVCDLAQVPLGGGQVRMSQYDLAYNLNGYAGTRCKGGRVAA